MRIHELVSSWGWEGHVYATAHDDRMASVDEGMKSYRGKRKSSREDILIYHLSVYDDNHRQYLQSHNRKVLIYHNITPPGFLAPYDAFLADVCKRGRELIPRLKECDLALGDSEYNREELVEAGFAREKTGVLPIFIDTESLGGDYNSALYDSLLGKGTNLLFVGRMVPNKRIEDLIDLFAVYNKRIDAYSRLFLVGTTWSVTYNAELARRIRRYGLQGSVFIPGWAWGVSDEDLRAYYRAADVFITCSRHEGFCVPLVESMFFGVPILARAETAIPFTLGGAGMTFKEMDTPLLAEALGELVSNQSLRDAMVEKGRKRLEDFYPERTAEKLSTYLRSLGP